MFIFCDEKSLRFKFKEPPVFGPNAYDTTFMYFIKIPSERTNSYNYEEIGHER